MSKQNERHTQGQLGEHNHQEERSQRPVKKKQFIEPTVSVPLDVLETTTNFLFVTSLTSTVVA